MNQGKTCREKWAKPRYIWHLFSQWCHWMTLVIISFSWEKYKTRRLVDYRRGFFLPTSYKWLRTIRKYHTYSSKLWLQKLQAEIVAFHSTNSMDNPAFELEEPPFPYEVKGTITFVSEKLTLCKCANICVQHYVLKDFMKRDNGEARYAYRVRVWDEMIEKCNFQKGKNYKIVIFSYHEDSCHNSNSKYFPLTIEIGKREASQFRICPAIKKGRKH